MGYKDMFATAALGVALSLGSGAAPAEPQQDISAKTAQSLTSDFNNHAKAVVLQRNLDRDVAREPLLIKQENGRYLIHEGNGFMEKLRGEGEGHLQSYSKDELISKHGPLNDIRTLEQFQADAAVLKKTPGLGRNLSESSDFMQFRVKEIADDMKSAGESFNPAPSQKPAVNAI